MLIERRVLITDGAGTIGSHRPKLRWQSSKRPPSTRQAHGESHHHVRVRRGSVPTGRLLPPPRPPTRSGWTPCGPTRAVTAPALGLSGASRALQLICLRHLLRRGHYAVLCAAPPPA